jgi:hypothetical protein
MAMPVFAQYAGPAILSRGEAPAAMNGPDIDFRPFVEVSGVYSTGLAGVVVNAQGNVPNPSSGGVQATGGLSGLHRWRHTTIGLSYRGNYAYYNNSSQSNTYDQSLLLSVNHQISRHLTFSLSNSFGIINRDYGLLSTLSPAVTFDPAQSYVPTTDFFDNRTIFVSSQANLVIQRSTRLSFSFGGGVFINRRASSALYGVTGLSAHGDVQYRLSKQATFGANYSYSHYLYTGLINSTDVHSANATFAYRLGQWWEFSGSGGMYRSETKFIQDVPVDPAVAAIIGIFESSEVLYNVRYGANIAARLSRTFGKGVAFVTVTRGIVPGNGLFLTSTATNVNGGYNYSGLIKKWSIGTNVAHQEAVSIGNVIGSYGGTSVGVNIARQISGDIHVTLGGTVFKYGSSVFSKYNQLVYSAHLGLGWTPGRVPLRIW